MYASLIQGPKAASRSYVAGSIIHLPDGARAADALFDLR
jgi:hypothetical protein